MKRLLAYVGVLVLVLPGCTRHVLDFTALSTKSASLPEVKGTPIHAETCAERVLVFIPLNGRMHPDLQEAVSLALEEGKGNLLIDGRVSSSIVWVPLLYRKHCYLVDGTAVTVQ